MVKKTILLLIIMILLPSFSDINSENDIDIKGNQRNDKSRSGYKNEPVQKIMDIIWGTEYRDLAEEISFDSVREVGNVKDCMKFNNNPIDNIDVPRIDYFFFKNQFYMIQLHMSGVTSKKMQLIREKYVNKFGSPHEKRESYFDAKHNQTTPDVWIWNGKMVNTILFLDVSRNAASIIYRFNPIDAKVPKKDK